MHHPSLDELRRSTGAAGADLTDAFVGGRIDRRGFLRRGAMLGLSATSMAAVAQACSSQGDDGTEPDESSSAASSPSDSAAADPGSDPNRIIVGVAQGEANSGLDPVNMTDVGTYAVVAQSFEYLVGVSEDGAVEASGLASSWEPDDDGSVWTFVLRDGPTWSDGSPLVAADVAATIDRLIAVGNAGFDGVLSEGAVITPDESTVVFRLDEPYGNFPSLLSPDNPQSVITPADYRTGTTLDARIEGTGPWILVSFDAPTFVATFRKNPSWWGGRVATEAIELRGFADETEALEALHDGDIDAVQRITTATGRAMLDHPALSVTTRPSSAHRQMWFNTQTGPFRDRRLRLAVAWAVDRSGVLADTNLGCGVVANDHPVHPDLGSVPFHDPDATPQRVRDVDRAVDLLADVGVGDFSTMLHTNESPSALALADSVRSSLAEADVDVVVQAESEETFYRETWCPEPDSATPCRGAASFGIIENGHEALPDELLARAFGSGGVWNASNYANDEFDRLLRRYRRSIDLDGQRDAIGALQRLLWADVPAVIPCFEDLVSARRTNVSGVRTLASGQVLLSDVRRR